MQVYQAIYNDITGKTENITDEYSKNFRVSIEDLIQLKHKVSQFCEQYNVEGQNHNITIYHIKATKERFSSFERFSAYNSSNTSPIERIVIELNILIVLPKVRKPQPYKVRIALTSGLAMLAKHEKDFPKNVPVNMIIKAIQAESAEVEIEYIDYIVARSISDLIREWIESLPQTESSQKILKLQNNSHYVRSFIYVSFTLITILFSLKFANIVLSSTSLSEVRLSSFLILSMSFVFFAYRLGIFLGHRVERAIDSIKGNEFSVININNGDKTLIEKQRNKIKKSKVKVLKESLIAVVLGFLGSVLANIISNAVSTKP